MSESFKIVFSGITQTQDSTTVPEFSASPILNYDVTPNNNDDMVVIGSTNLNSYFIDKKPTTSNTNYSYNYPNTQVYTDVNFACSTDWDFSGVIRDGLVRAGPLTRITGLSSGAVRGGSTIYLYKNGDDIYFQGGLGFGFGANNTAFTPGEIIFIQFYYFFRTGENFEQEKYLESVITGYYKVSTVQESDPAGNPLIYITCPDDNIVNFTKPVDIVSDYSIGSLADGIDNPLNFGGTNIHYSHESSAGRKESNSPKIAAIPRYRSGLSLCKLDVPQTDFDITTPSSLSPTLENYLIGNSSYSNNSTRVVDVVSYDRAGVLFVALRVSGGVQIHVVDSTTLAFETIKTFQLFKGSNTITADKSIKLEIPNAVTQIERTDTYPSLPLQPEKLVVSYASSDGTNGVRIYNLSALETFVPIIPSATPTATPTPTPTITVSPTVTPSMPVTPSNTPTLTATPTVTPTVTTSDAAQYRYTRKSIVLENLDCGEYELTIDYMSHQFGPVDVQILDGDDIEKGQFDNIIKFTPQNIQTYRRNSTGSIASDEKYNQRIFYTIYHSVTIDQAILKFTLKHLPSGKERVETRIIECEGAGNCLDDRVECVKQNIQKFIQLPDGSFEVYVALDPPPTVRKDEPDIGKVVKEYIDKNKCCDVALQIEDIIDWYEIDRTDIIACDPYTGVPTPTPSVTPTITPTPSYTATSTPTPTATPTPTPTTTDTVIPCGELFQEGGQGFYTYQIPLKQEGGTIIFDIDPFDVPDKIELIHNDITKATSSMTNDGNFGPFDNTDDPFTTQFIGTSKGAIPDRLAEFKSSTGLSSYEITSGYRQVLWWTYTSSDWSTAVYATIRVGAPSSGTKWRINRRCEGES